MQAFSFSAQGITSQLESGATEQHVTEVFLDFEITMRAHRALSGSEFVLALQRVLQIGAVKAKLSTYGSGSWLVLGEVLRGQEGIAALIEAVIYQSTK